jgi:hypothetical protein
MSSASPLSLGVVTEVCIKGYGHGHGDRGLGLLGLGLELGRADGPWGGWGEG